MAPDPLPVEPAGQSDICAEAVRLAQVIAASGLRLKIMGGLAIWLTSRTARSGPFAREYGDLDVVADSRDRRAVEALLESNGYLPDRLFNALHGAQRLIYRAADAPWTLDVIFDELNMSHRIDLRGRLGGPVPTLDPADLLMTKLQIWQVNEKDVGDTACLLADAAIAVPPGRAGPGSPAAIRDVPASGSAAADTGPRLATAATDPSVDPVIDAARIRALTGSDWGLSHTVEGNLARIVALWRSTPVPVAPHDAAEQAETLLREIRSGPKTFAWRARARIGERVRWYETPEDVRK